MIKCQNGVAIVGKVLFVDRVATQIIPKIINCCNKYFELDQMIFSIRINLCCLFCFVLASQFAIGTHQHVP